MQPLMIPVDQIRILAGHNARADVGDVRELADSIRALGVLQALTVVALELENGEPVYGLVAGERRLTAARQVGLAEVPCVVQDLDERQRIAAMLVENLQRQDLAVLEEARGIRRLADLGLSQREIARQLGRNQSHISKRLALLTLPEEIQAAIDQPREGVHGDARGITVAEALELTRLGEHPMRQADAFQRGRSWYAGVAGLVKEQLAELEREQARAAARSRLMAEGTPIIKERDYYGWTDMRERPLTGQKGHEHAAVGISVEEHQGEPCHAAAIDRLGEVVYVCSDPSRHADTDPKTAAQIVAGRQLEEEQRAGNRLRREAARGRQEAMERVLAAANSSQLAFAAHQITSHWRLEESKVACRLLGLEPIVVRGPYGEHKDHQAALSAYAGGSMASAIRALVALALACGEATFGSTYGVGRERGKRHLEQLTAAGYEPNDSDLEHLTGEPDPGAGDPDEPACRICGRTEAEVDEDGQGLVEDPDGQGDLCSRCLDEWVEPGREATPAAPAEALG